MAKLRTNLTRWTKRWRQQRQHDETLAAAHAWQEAEREQQAERTAARQRILDQAQVIRQRQQ